MINTELEVQQIDASAALAGRDAKQHADAGGNRHRRGAPDQDTRHARQDRRTAGFRSDAAENAEGNQRRCHQRRTCPATGTHSATSSGNSAPREKLRADANAACSGRARVAAEMPSSSRVGLQRIMRHQLFRYLPGQRRIQPAMHVDRRQFAELPG